MEDKMRKYLNQNSRELQEIKCNMCGRTMQIENGYLKEDCFTAEHVFGYFSAKDGTRHRFDLCESCYDKMVAGFAIPAEVSEETELV